MKIPTDPIDLTIFVLNIVLAGISIDEAIGRLATGIAATAEKEGRDVTEAESAYIRGLRDAAAK